MRGEDLQQSALFSYLSPEQRVPQDHPLRKLLPLVDAALARMSRRFTAMYARGGRPSIAPEKLLRALLLQILYTVRSERLLMERLDHDLLFRWFVGLHMDDPVWEAPVYSKNRERLLSSDVAGAFFRQVVAQARKLDLLSDEHFTVDGTLIEAWASQKSFKPKAGGEAEPPAEGSNPEVNFRGEKRRHPSVDHRPGGTAVQEGQRARGEAGLSRPCADGEPPRLGGEHAADLGDGHGGAGGGGGDGTAAREASGDAGGRQER